MGSKSYSRENHGDDKVLRRNITEQHLLKSNPVGSSRMNRNMERSKSQSGISTVLSASKKTLSVKAQQQLDDLKT